MAGIAGICWRCEARVSVWVGRKKKENKDWASPWRRRASCRRRDVGGVHLGAGAASNGGAEDSARRRRKEEDASGDFAENPLDILETSKPLEAGPWFING